MKRDLIARSLRARWLGRQMRMLRDWRGLSLKYVAASLGVDFSVVARLERGELAVNRGTVSALLDAYHVHDAKEREALLRLAQAAWRPSWEVDFDGAIPDESLIDLVWLESEATRIDCYSPLTIPDLLHTPEYAQMVARSEIADHGRTQEGMSAWERLIAERQCILHRTPEPVEFNVVLNECVLTHPVGEASVWREQLEHLRKVAAAAHVRLGVLPVGKARFASAVSGFTIFTSSQPYAPAVVHIEYLGGRLLMDEGSDRYRAVFGQLTDAATDADQHLERTVRESSENSGR